MRGSLDYLRYRPGDERSQRHRDARKRGLSHPLLPGRPTRSAPRTQNHQPMSRLSCGLSRHEGGPPSRGRIQPPLIVAQVPSTLEATGSERPPARRPLPPGRQHVIGPPTMHVGARLREAWAYRRLILYFAHRLLQKFYIRTWLGWAWVPLRPIADVGSRVLLFGALLGVPSGDRPYLVFFIVGMGAWQLFDRTVYWTTRSVEVTRDVFRRVAVPRLPALVSGIVPSAVDYLLYVVMTIGIVLYYVIAQGDLYVNLAPNLQQLATVAGLALLVALALSIGLWTAVFGARARDIRFSFAYVMGLWFFLTPVIYPISAIPEQFRSLVQFNPATAPIELVKHGLLDTAPPSLGSVLVTLGLTGVLMAGGLWFFLRWEQAGADAL